MKTDALIRWAAGPMLVITTAAFAQEWRDALPGEPLYEAKQRIETAELNAAVDPLEKASVHLQHADSRVEEMRRSAARGNTESLDRLSEDYAGAMQQAEEHIARARSRGRDTSRASQQVGAATQKHTEVLTGLLDQVPEQAVPAIRHAREVSQRGRRTALEQLRGSDGRRGIERDAGKDRRSPANEANEGFPSRPDADGRRGDFPGSTGGSRRGGGLPEGAGGGGLPGGGGSPGGRPPGR